MSWQLTVDCADPARLVETSSVSVEASSARPTRLLVARHGDADYGAHGLLSDEGGVLTDVGVMQCRALAQALADDDGDSVVAVYSSTMERAVETGETAAAVLGLTNTAMDGLQEFQVGDFAGRPYGDPDVQAVFQAWVDGHLEACCPGAEDGAAIVARMKEALERIAAAHPAQRVLVFSHGGVMSLVIPRLGANVDDALARDRFLPNAVPAEVDVRVPGDWTVVSWPGSASRSVV